jgi:DNA-directed RNA polymerase subunit E'/Rpb7
MTYKNTQLLQTSINIKINDLNGDIDNTILLKMQEKYEGICTENAYIINDSIKIINRNMGKVATINNSSVISYIINYTADIISPTEGDEIDIFVEKNNKMGILGYVEKDKYNFETSPIIVIIPLEYFEDNPLDINSITAGKKLKIKILGCRIKYKAKKIQIIGSPLL